MLALGNSIVTRAGPALQLSGIEKKPQAQTVYNFSVQEFSTYFVGKSALWVHNTICSDFIDLLFKDGKQALDGKSLEEVKAALGNIEEPWVQGVLTKGDHVGQGWTLRKKLPNGEYSDFYLQWHPGSDHHPEIEGPYWKFSSGITGTQRFVSKVE